LSIKNPISHGTIQNWGDFESLIEYSFFNELQLSPEDHPVLFCESIVATDLDRKNIASLMFETLNSSAIFQRSSSILGLYGSGKVSGLVVDSGQGVTSVVPITEGHSFPHAIVTMDIGGGELTDYLSNNLISYGFKFESLSEKETVDKIKISECFTSMKPEREEEDNDELLKQYVLPDGQKITLSSQRFMVPEILFNPSILGLDITGVHEKITESIALCNIDVRKELYNNITLLGGTVQFPNFKKRLDAELEKRAPEKIKVKTSISKTPRITNWLGGSIFSTLGSFSEEVLTKSEYDEDNGSTYYKKSWVKEFYS